MSKVSIELDTKTDELTVTVDGKVLEHVTDVSIYKWEDYKDTDMVSISIGISEKAEDKDDLQTHMRLVARRNEDFAEPTEDAKKVYEDIAKFLNIGGK